MASSQQPPPIGITGSPDPPSIKLNGTGGGGDSGKLLAPCHLLMTSLLCTGDEP
jgi:hypothetical protein